MLALVFKIADDNGLLLLDLKDLRAMLQFVGDNAAQFTTAVRQRLGGVDRRDPARRCSRSSSRAATQFFGEPMLNIDDLLQTDAQRPRRRQRPRGRRADAIAAALRDVPALAAVRAVRAAARGRRPRQAEARVLLRRGAPAVQRRAAGAAREDRAGRAADPLEGRRRVLRHAESRSTCPTTCSASSATACSTRCARSRRATRRRCKTAAETLRPNPKLDIEQAITELAVGEALVSLLDEKGSPAITERAWIVPPASRIGPITDAERDAGRKANEPLVRPLRAGGRSRVRVREAERTDREDRRSRATPAKPGSAAPSSEPAPASATGPSAGSIRFPPVRLNRRPRQPRLCRRLDANPNPGRYTAGTARVFVALRTVGADVRRRRRGPGITGALTDFLFGHTGPRGGHYDGALASAGKSAARSVGSGIGRAILRGALGSILKSNGSDSRQHRTTRDSRLTNSTICLSAQ